MRGILPATLATAAALVATIAWELQDTAPRQPGIAAGAAPVAGLMQDASGPDMNVLAQGWAGAMLARPLFRENRRPAKTADGVAMTADDTRLTGVITGPFGKRAIFKAAQNPKPIVVEVGARVGDLMVRAIEPGQAVVESDGKVFTLKPSPADGKAPARR